MQRTQHVSFVWVTKGGREELLLIIHVHGERGMTANVPDSTRMRIVHEAKEMTTSARKERETWCAINMARICGSLVSVQN